MNYNAALAALRQKTSLVPKLALICGSGLSGLQDALQIECRIPYAEIPGLPRTENAWHTGEFIFGTLQGLPVVITGRLHLYDGFTPEETILPIRLARKMGAEYLLLTCNCGGIRDDLVPGDLLLVEDHLSFLVPSPLRGANDESIGPRFPVGCCYDKEFSSLIRRKAEEENMPLKSGIYIQTAGPQFESAAEIRFYRAAGADVVGMSGATDAIGGHHCGLKVANLSLVANKAAGLSKNPISLPEIRAAAEASSKKLGAILRRVAAGLA